MSAAPTTASAPPAPTSPGSSPAGSCKKDGVSAFWDVHDLDKAIVITTAHEKFARLVVEVEVHGRGGRADTQERWPGR